MFTEETIPARVGAFQGRQIRDARTAKQWTQKRLASACNLQVSVIQQYESGRAVMDRRTVETIKRALGIHRIRKQPKSTLQRQQESWDKEMASIRHELLGDDNDDYGYDTLTS